MRSEYVAPTMSDPFEVRATDPADAPALNELYFRLTGLRRSIAQWRWEWLECPQGPAPSWVIVDRASGRIVGHHGVVPIELALGGRRIAAARTENTMVDPEFRTRIRYPAIEARLLRQLLTRFDLIYTTSGKGAHGLVRRRLGYTAAGTWRTYTVAMTLGYAAARLAGPAAGRAVSPLGLIRRGPGRRWALAEADDIGRVASLCAEWADGTAIGPLRTAELLAWRLLRHPFHQIQLALARENGRDRAFIAWREAAGPRDALDIHVEDLCAAENDPATMRQALCLLAHRYRSRAARVTLRTLAIDRPLARAARPLRPLWLGREAAENGAELLIRSDRVLPMPWDATMVLAEGI